MGQTCWTSYSTYSYCPSYCCGSSTYNLYCCSDCSMAYSSPCLNVGMYVGIAMACFIVISIAIFVPLWYFKWYRVRQMAMMIPAPVIAPAMTIQQQPAVIVQQGQPMYPMNGGYVMAMNGAPPPYVIQQAQNQMPPQQQLQQQQPQMQLQVGYPVQLSASNYPNAFDSNQTSLGQPNPGFVKF